MIEPQTLIVGICIQRSRHELDLGVKQGFPFLLPCLPLVQQPRNKLAAIMPRAEVAEVGVHHLRRVRVLVLDHALSRELLQFCHSATPVGPSVKIPTIKRQHLAYEHELALPELRRILSRQVLRGCREQPAAVVPDPVAFRILFEQRDEEGEVFG